MPDYLAVVSLPKKSGIPQDAVENTFAFHRTEIGGSIVDGPAIRIALLKFYNTVPVGLGGSVASQFSASFSTVADAGSLKVYDISATLGGGDHGSPVYTATFNLTGVGADSMADEVCACLSIESAYGTDIEFGVGSRPRARDRGRIFLGPLAQFCLATDATTKETRLATNPQQIFAKAAAALLSDGVGWSVWSRKDAALKPVVKGWVDNAFDIQRRRGNAATARTNWDATGLI